MSCCVNSREGLEPRHSLFSLHQLSLIAKEDRIPWAQLFFILFGAFEACKVKGLLLIFSLFLVLVFFSLCVFLTILTLRKRQSFHTMPSSLSTQNNYQALPHQIMVDIGGHDGEGQRSAGWPQDVLKRPSNLKGRLLSLGYFYLPRPRFSFVCPNESLSCKGSCRGLAVAGLRGQSTMKLGAVVRQGRICAILLSFGKELMCFNGLQLRADLLTSTCSL